MAERKPREHGGSTAYDADYALWATEQATRLRRGELGSLDRENIAEELEALGKSDRRALASSLRNLLLHLLKHEFQPRRRTSSWLNSIQNARENIEDILEDSPSLRGEMADRVSVAYARARKAASLETALPLKSFPPACPYTLKQLLDENFLPGKRGGST